MLDVFHLFDIKILNNSSCHAGKSRPISAYTLGLSKQLSIDPPRNGSVSMHYDINLAYLPRIVCE